MLGGVTAEFGAAVRGQQSKMSILAEGVLLGCHESVVSWRVLPVCLLLCMCVSASDPKTQALYFNGMLDTDLKLPAKPTSYS